MSAETIERIERRITEPIGPRLTVAVKWVTIGPFYALGWAVGVVARSLRLMLAALAEGFKDGAR